MPDPEPTRVNLYGPVILPGIQIQRGVLVMDEAQLSYPGDLLHEAAHLAVGSGREAQPAG